MSALPSILRLTHRGGTSARRLPPLYPFTTWSHRRFSRWRVHDRPDHLLILVLSGLLDTDGSSRHLYVWCRDSASLPEISSISILSKPLYSLSEVSVNLPACVDHPFAYLWQACWALSGRGTHEWAFSGGRCKFDSRRRQWQLECLLLTPTLLVLYWHGNWNG